MDTNKLIDSLMAFGLTRQEATVYLAVFENGTMTGYEVAKQTGISRSNAYNALAGLVDKGAAYAGEGAAKKYSAVDVKEFCQNKVRSLNAMQDYLVENMPKAKEEVEGYLTIEGDSRIEDKVRNMLAEAEQRVYLEMSLSNLKLFKQELEQLREKDIKVVLISDGKLKLDGAKQYETKVKEKQIGVITDSSHVLTGEYGNGELSNCLYTGQKNFVQIFKDSLKNEIKLIELTKGE